MSRAASTAPPLWIHLLLALMSAGLALFLFSGLIMGDCTFPDRDPAQLACLAGKRVAVSTYPPLVAALWIAGLLVRRGWGAWSLVLTILAAPVAFALTLIAESVAI